jgi:hypothetical protein
MSSVESWLIDILHPSEEEEQQQVKVTVRLDAFDYSVLKDVAVSLGLSATGAASGLLSSAILEAAHFLRLGDQSEQARRETLEAEEGVPA